MSTRSHVQSFLSSIDTAYSLRAIGAHLMESAKTDSEIAGLFETIQSNLGSGQSIVSDCHSAMFERLKTPAAIPDIPSAPEWARPLIAVAYLKARSALACRGTPLLHDNLRKALKKVAKLTEEVETDFVGELLVETTLAAREDRAFAQALARAGHQFMELAEALYGEPPEPAPPETDSPVAAAASGQAGARCTACRTVDGVRRCAPISCWVIVIVIVIIIVTK